MKVSFYVIFNLSIVQAFYPFLGSSRRAYSRWCSETDQYRDQDETPFLDALIAAKNTIKGVPMLILELNPTSLQLTYTLSHIQAGISFQGTMVGRMLL